MKKIYRSWMVVLLLMGLLTGCASKPAVDTPTTAPTDAATEPAPTEATQPEPTQKPVGDLQAQVNQQLEEQKKPTEPAEPNSTEPAVLELGDHWQVFWDDYLVDSEKTTAQLIQHSPDLQEIVITFDKPWEGDATTYCSVVKDGDLYRMYYRGWELDLPNRTDSFICCLESTDGVNWYRPELSVRAYPGYETTSILLDKTDGWSDNFYVFLDENPACPQEERYKGVAYDPKSTWLWYWVSADGYHFERVGVIDRKGAFDSLNTAFWSKTHEKYYCFYREFHVDESGQWIRDIRVKESIDFETWSEPQWLDYGDARTVALYTNGIQSYYRDPSIFVGMPTRYAERKEWTGNFSQMPDKQERLERMELDPRYGLATTDCVLMTSRDGTHWKRQEEAWLTPGIERDFSWVYGDCYPAIGFVETPSDLPGAPNELSYFMVERYWGNVGNQLRRYTGRIDGLLSYHAKAEEATLVTKPFVYEGGQLHLNFSSSALGYLYVTMSDGENSVTSCELFGDSLDRWVNFSGNLHQFVGKEVTLTFSMSDADLYAMQFVNE